MTLARFICVYTSLDKKSDAFKNIYLIYLFFSNLNKNAFIQIIKYLNDNIYGEN